MAKKKKSEFSKRATRIRISMIAHERGLSNAEIAKVMNCGTTALVQFAEKHDVSLDWLICGDLKGLLRTVRAAGVARYFGGGAG